MSFVSPYIKGSKLLLRGLIEVPAEIGFANVELSAEARTFWLRAEGIANEEDSQDENKGEKVRTSGRTRSCCGHMSLSRRGQKQFLRTHSSSPPLDDV